MKKLLAILILMMLLVTSAYADIIDLSSMTVEELIALHEQIDGILQEKFECKLGVFYPGNYVVGRDIKEGQYIFSCTKVGLANFWILTTYETEEDFANRNSYAKQNLQVGGQVQINLTDGMVLSVGDGLGTIQPVVKSDWAP